MNASIIRKPADIPNQDGFRFVGVRKDAQFIWLCVQKHSDGGYALGEEVYATLDSWMTVEDFKKYILPTVEAVQFTAQAALLQRLCDEASAITASGFPANSDVETTGWRIDTPLYLELEAFLFPSDEPTEVAR